jgi:uncharacterized protein DUF4332
MGGMENDLYKLNGIGPKHTEMLESIGVDSIKELSHRNAASLKEMIRVTTRPGHRPVGGFSPGVDRPSEGGAEVASGGRG